MSAPIYIAASISRGPEALKKLASQLIQDHKLRTEEVYYWTKGQDYRSSAISEARAVVVLPNNNAKLGDSIQLLTSGIRKEISSALELNKPVFIATTKWDGTFELKRLNKASFIYGARFFVDIDRSFTLLSTLNSHPTDSVYQRYTHTSSDGTSIQNISLDTAETKKDPNFFFVFM